VHPERGDDWFTEQSAGMNPKGIAQELMCNFEGSGTTYFRAEDIEWLRSNVAQPSYFSGPKNKGSDFWIWKQPIEERKYIVSIDVARGDAEDFSAFHVIDTVEHEVVAEYVGKIAPDRFGDFLLEVGNKYNKALLIFEKNTFGHSLGIRLRDINYKNVYYEEKVLEKLLYADEEEKKDLQALAGFTITSGNREKVVNKLEEIIRNRRVRLYSSRFLEQTENFIWTGKKAQAIKKKNDDLILSLCLAFQIYEPAGDIQQNASGGGMEWQLAFLASLRRSGVSRGAMETGISNFGARTQTNPFLPGPTRNQNSPVNPVQSFNAENGKNKFLGRTLMPGVDPNKVAQDYFWRTLIDGMEK
jgi:hypothetical protein